MRLSSALIGALAVLFAFLLARELAPRRPWLGVLAALLVAYEPMYGFISGIVNNDVGVNAAAAALELLLIRLLRRGMTVPWGVAHRRSCWSLLPIVKGTGLSLYPAAGAGAPGRAVAPSPSRATCAAGRRWRWPRCSRRARGAPARSRPSPPARRPAAAAALGDRLQRERRQRSAAPPPGYLSYLWQVFLPRLSFMAPHFARRRIPAS